MSEQIPLSKRLHYQHPLNVYVAGGLKHFRADDVREFLASAAMEAERLEREVAALRNDLQRVDSAYRELESACDIAKATCSPHGLDVLNAALAKRGAT